MFYKKNIVDQSSEFQGGILNKELWREEVRVMNSNLDNGYAAILDCLTTISCSKTCRYEGM